MSWQVVRFEDATPQPWRNGGGVTRELLAWPNATDWCLRVSVADINQDGPFSAFNGVDRWFAVLTGAGVWLGTPPEALHRDGSVVHFAGESAPACRLIDGATRDLNLMTRRAVASGAMTRLDERVTPLRIEPAKAGVTRLRGVFTVGGGLLDVAGSETFELPPMSMAWQLLADPLETLGETTFTAVAGTQGNFFWHCEVVSRGESLQ